MGRLIARPDERTRKGERLILHPTWHVEYLQEAPRATRVAAPAKEQPSE